ncbi:hypothetical protein PA3_09230 [Acinetobacter pittii]|uniref:Uncharacterized protein n=1 Tax=Acinetobacter pittii TaxID=48296 RepID=A0A4Y3J6E2_ACIPI|nr:hypothetical protein [Acinetobacter pittii]GEA66765.1 hypothetical protein PA3_09230 [Acinetobacter pittii]
MIKMNPTTPNIEYQPKIALIITPFIPISLLILLSVLTGKFTLDLLYIIGIFVGTYYIILFPLLLKICQVLITKNRFIFPLMWLGAHVSFSLIYFFLAVYENISHNLPIFDYVFPTVGRTLISTSTFTVSFILSLIFWFFASFQPRLKAKHAGKSQLNDSQ